MAYFGLLWKARAIERYRTVYEREKLHSIMISNAETPKKTMMQKWRHYRHDTRKRMGNALRKLCPEGTPVSNFIIYLKTDQTFPNFVWKSVIGFVGGIVLTYLCFMFFVFQLAISLVHATIMSSIIGVLLTLGLAFSYRVRCLVFLLIPQFFSRVGRYTLTCYALVLILTGPATNTLRNSEVLSESMACGQEQVKTNVRQITESIKKPFNSMKDTIRSMIERVKQVAVKLKDTLLKVHRLVMSIVRVLQSAFSWLSSIVGMCNKKVGTPYVRCTRALTDGVLDCQARLGPYFSWLCNVVYVAQVACWAVKPLDLICVLVEFVSGTVVATIKRKLRTFSNHVKTMLYVSVHVHHSYSFSSNSSRSASQVAAGIVTEIRHRAEPLLTWLSWSSCVTSLFLCLIIFRAKYYQHMYETRSRYDNRYVTRDLRDLDLRRARENRDTVLPLNRRERAKYVTTTSFRLVASEKLYLTRSVVFMGITTFKLLVHMVADYSLYWVLMTIRYHGRFQSLQLPGVADAGVLVVGAGPVAGMVRSLVDSLSLPLTSPAPSPASCLPDPYPPDLQRYTQIGVLIFLLWFFALFEPYGLRLRHVIMGHYRPERAKARAVWLYNHILRTRGGFLKLARRKLHRDYKYSTEERFTFRQWLDAHIPCWWLRSLMGTSSKEPHCLLCGTTELSNDSDSQLIHCETPNCPGVYCTSCFADIGQLCTICLSPVDYGDMSDMSLEKGSSDDSDNDGSDSSGLSGGEQSVPNATLPPLSNNSSKTKSSNNGSDHINKKPSNNQDINEQLKLTYFKFDNIDHNKMINGRTDPKSTNYTAECIHNKYQNKNNNKSNYEEKDNESIQEIPKREHSSNRNVNFQITFESLLKLLHYFKTLLKFFTPCTFYKIDRTVYKLKISKINRKGRCRINRKRSRYKKEIKVVQEIKSDIKDLEPFTNRTAVQSHTNTNNFGRVVQCYYMRTFNSESKAERLRNNKDKNVKLNISIENLSSKHVSQFDEFSGKIFLKVNNLPQYGDKRKRNKSVKINTPTETLGCTCTRAHAIDDATHSTDLEKKINRFPKIRNIKKAVRGSQVPLSLGKSMVSEKVATENKSKHPPYKTQLEWMQDQYRRDVGGLTKEEKKRNEILMMETQAQLEKLARNEKFKYKHIKVKDNDIYIPRTITWSVGPTPYRCGCPTTRCVCMGEGELQSYQKIPNKKRENKSSVVKSIIGLFRKKRDSTEMPSGTFIKKFEKSLKEEVKKQQGADLAKNPGPEDCIERCPRFYKNIEENEEYRYNSTDRSERQSQVKLEQKRKVPIGELRRLTNNVSGGKLKVTFRDKKEVIKKTDPSVSISTNTDYVKPDVERKESPHNRGNKVLEVKATLPKLEWKKEVVTTESYTKDSIQINKDVSEAPVPTEKLKPKKHINKKKEIPNKHSVERGALKDLIETVLSAERIVSSDKMKSKLEWRRQVSIKSRIDKDIISPRKIDQDLSNKNNNSAEKGKPTQLEWKKETQNPNSQSEPQISIDITSSEHFIRQDILLDQPLPSDSSAVNATNKEITPIQGKPIEIKSDYSSSSSDDLERSSRISPLTWLLKKLVEIREDVLNLMSEPDVDEGLFAPSKSKSKDSNVYIKDAGTKHSPMEPGIERAVSTRSRRSTRHRQRTKHKCNEKETSTAVGQDTKHTQWEKKVSSFKKKSPTRQFKPSQGIEKETLAAVGYDNQSTQWSKENVTLDTKHSLDNGSHDIHYHSTLTSMEKIIMKKLAYYRSHSSLNAKEMEVFKRLAPKILSRLYVKYISRKIKQKIRLRGFSDSSLVKKKCDCRPCPSKPVTAIPSAINFNYNSSEKLRSKFTSRHSHCHLDKMATEDGLCDTSLLSDWWSEMKAVNSNLKFDDRFGGRVKNISHKSRRDEK